MDSKKHNLKEEFLTRTSSEAESELILARVKEILEEYKQESNIPLTHEYWTLMDRHRTLSNGPK